MFVKSRPQKFWAGPVACSGDKGLIMIFAYGRAAWADGYTFSKLRCLAGMIGVCAAVLQLLVFEDCD